MSLHVVREDILRLSADPLVLGHFADVRPLAGNTARLDWVLNAAVSRAWRSNPSLFEFGRLTLLATGGKFPFPRVLVVGLGRKDRFAREERREAFRIGLSSAVSIGGARAVVEPFPCPASGDPFLGAAEDLEKALAGVGKGPIEVTLAVEAASSARRRA